MDLIFSICLLISIFVYKMTRTSEHLVESSIVTESGYIEETIINENNLVIGNNLMLMKEPRAYHKILDDMGLS